MNTDILRICHELHTFTIAELAETLDMSDTGAVKHIERFMRLRYIERIRVGYTFVYAATPKLALLVSKLPPLDINEMCLPLDFGEGSDNHAE